MGALFRSKNFGIRRTRDNIERNSWFPLRDASRSMVGRRTSTELRSWRETRPELVAVSLIQPIPDLSRLCLSVCIPQVHDCCSFLPSSFSPLEFCFNSKRAPRRGYFVSPFPRPFDRGRIARAGVIHWEHRDDRKSHGGTAIKIAGYRGSRFSTSGEPFRAENVTYEKRCGVIDVEAYVLEALLEVS